MMPPSRLAPLLLLALSLSRPAAAAPAADPAASPPPAPVLADVLNRHADYGWFLEDRFGMFIHFGLYSLAARHEWVMHREKISPQDYRKYFEAFNPDLADARAWARAAKTMGARYVVLTTKHHEGFCLFDSALTDYKITNTPFGRDLVREYVEAARAEGLKVGFYYSLFDWHHPQFPVDGLHPLRDDEAFRQAEAGRDMAKYREYLHGQVRELLTNYGRVDYLWFDYSYSSQNWGWSRGKGAEDWHSEELVKLIHSLQPHVIINNRLGIVGGGVQTPEQHQPRFTGMPTELKLIEECHTLNGSWGYDRDNLAWKPADLLVRMLVDATSKGHNLLLNIAPTGRGDLDPRTIARIEAVGEWMRQHQRAIYGAGPSAVPAPNGTRYTQKGDRLYLHLFDFPFARLDLDGLRGKVRYAQLLHDGSEIRFKDVKAPKEGADPEALEISLPPVRPDVLVPVVELFLK